jgi:hypothetical protein
MIDPMANIGDTPGAPSETSDKDVIDFVALQVNLQRVDKVRSVMGIASGCVAGICGLTGWEGLGMLLLLHLHLTNFGISLLISFRPFALCLVLCSMFCYFAHVCSHFGGWHENELSTLRLHKTVLDLLFIS